MHSAPGNATQELVVHAAAVGKSTGPVEIAQSSRDGAEDAATVEWWRDENTPFKEFAREFSALKGFGGALDVAQRKPLDVLSWRL